MKFSTEKTESRAVSDFESPERAAPEQLYYIQFLGQGYVGNCMLLWGPNNNGYTTELDKAGLYTAAQLRNKRPEDQPWPREVLDLAAVRHVRGEGLFPRDVGWVFDDELNEWRER